ncbi:hypothetical protein ACUHMQ_06595 [Chitinimonas sp. PSY-7]|uniref:hypothetical protein n=1 Tax=Chitinimonas sp. PSY-7 TaxID=3459088 RepID=UPI0040402C35
MFITTYAVIDMASGAVLEQTGYDYDGPVAECKKGGKAPSPDPAIGQAAIENAKLGKDWLAFSRQQWEAQQPRQAEIDQYSRQFADQQLADSKFNSERARELWSDYTTTFRPIEQQVAKEAMQYDSEGRQASESAASVASVGKQFDNAMAAQARLNGRMGVNPNSGRAGAVMNDMLLNRALATSAAETNTRRDLMKTGLMLRKDAASLGRGLPGTASQTFSTGTGMGTSGQGALQGAAGQVASNNAIMGNGFSGAIAGNSSAMNGLSQQYQNQLAAWQSSQAGNNGLLGLAGNIAGAWAGSGFKVGGK